MRQLDICTPKSSFGIHIPILARDYTPLLNSVLALAAQQQSLFLPPDSDEASQSAELATLATASIGLDIYSSRDEAVATCTLLMISELLSTQIQNWKRVLKGRIDFLGPLGIDGFSDGHHSSTSWVTLRLGMYIHDPNHLYAPNNYDTSPLLLSYLHVLPCCESVIEDMANRS